jgi:hypothetical protein
MKNTIINKAIKIKSLLIVCILFVGTNSIVSNDAEECSMEYEYDYPWIYPSICGDRYDGPPYVLIEDLNAICMPGMNYDPNSHNYPVIYIWVKNGNYEYEDHPVPDNPEDDWPNWANYYQGTGVSGDVLKVLVITYWGTYIYSCDYVIP